jgi:hypothetical protein
MPRHPDKTPGTGAAPSPSPSGTVVVPEVGSERAALGARTGPHVLVRHGDTGAIRVV